MNKKAVLVLLAALTAQASFAQTPAKTESKPAAAAPAKKDWVKRSDEIAKWVLEQSAKQSPEGAAQLGIDGYDEQILDLTPGYRERNRKQNLEILAELKKKLAAEKDTKVREDLAIMVENAEDGIRGQDLGLKYNIPYFNLPQFLFGSIRGLLDDQIPAERRKAALVRLRKYTGVEPGFKPLTELAKADTLSRINEPGLSAPYKGQIERNLGNADQLVAGIGQLFEKYKVEGYQEAYARLKEQITDYNKFVRETVLPRARQDYKLPAEIYAFQLEQYGVDVPPAELAAQAHAAFNDLQSQMQKVAAEVAKEKGWSNSDYRAVIAELKKDQLVGEAILPHYLERLKQIEQIIVREKLVTLPSRPARIRLATPAESAVTPAPNMRPPRLIGNTGEQAEFVLPLNTPTGSGKTERQDDFTLAAASWTLTAHETRPGHEMQFASMLENGVSTARAVFAFNSTNVEGWGLYAESITLPFMPKDGQLLSLNARLMRAARAFLDPELQSGKVTPEQALNLLKTDVVLSNALASQEVERYTFRSPGQATSYFYGYVLLKKLREDVEKALGKNFNQQKYHDFVLAQGLLPHKLLRKAVMEEFVPQQSGKSKAKTAKQ
jgi:uncharacterized protein (DUF885 family)